MRAETNQYGQRHRRTRAGRMKLHLRVLPLGGMRYHLLTLRPGTRAAFSTNFYHQTWHLVSDLRGARLLARLLWGLSYQRRPGTMVLVHGRHLVPTPFEAERSDPFLLVPGHLTPLNEHHLRRLKGQLHRLGPPTRTVRWLTFGLDAVREAGEVPGAEALHHQENRQLWHQERMVRCGGFVCYAAPAPVLRSQARRVAALHVAEGDGHRAMDYHFLAHDPAGDSWYGDGEVQIFADYRDRVAAAVEARRQFHVPPGRPVLSETLQEAISRRRDQIKRRKKRNRLGAASRV